MLQSFDGSVLVITHDRAFLDRVATAILAFEPDPQGRGVARVIRYSGGYQDYVAQRGDGRRPASVEPARAPPVVESVPKDRRSSENRALTYAERLELDAIVDAIEAAERGVAAVEAELADPALYASRGHEVARLQSRLKAARSKAAELVARWEALEAKKVRG
jgi:ATP-binding cassette subfamily F protein uup